MTGFADDFAQFQREQAERSRSAATTALADGRQASLFEPARQAKRSTRLADLRRAEAGRQEAVGALEIHRREVVAALRAEALRLWRLHRQPVTVNDVRHVLDVLAYRGNPVILATTFAGWRCVGETLRSGGRGHTNPIKMWVPEEVPPA